MKSWRCTPYSMLASSGTKNIARGHDGLGDLTMIKQTKQTNNLAL